MKYDNINKPRIPGPKRETRLGIASLKKKAGPKIYVCSD